MATTPKLNSSSSSPLVEISTKSHPLSFFLLFIALLISFLLLSSTAAAVVVGPSNPSMDMLSRTNALDHHPHEQTPFSDEKPAAARTSSSMEFRPSRKRVSRKCKGRDQFEVSDHEVPSGPNPISNR